MTWASLLPRLTQDEQVKRLQLFKKGDETMTYVYFTSLCHGSSMLLGAILGLDILQVSSRNAPINWKDVIRPKHLVLAITGLVVPLGYPGMLGFACWSQYQDTLLDYIWTASLHKLFALGFYGCLFILLICHNHRSLVAPWITRICDMLSWRLFEWIHPYTFGIYQFHHFVVVLLLWTGCHPNMEWIHFLFASRDPHSGHVLSWHPKVNQNGEPIYGYLYLLMLFSFVFVLTTAFAFCTFWLLEYPVEYFRYNFIRPKYTIAKKKLL
ncbi:hypothetical protein RFI_21867 [Reticulomyxa filosa]|uniref:Uncharacterized protein n=1 Tax=Reticulomyxa filosa TaxID=46433 RepID=X6MPA6_RETFI|nr:hypothetical protein RFI_21867 [Reticulomyxa filosa]|eukprot:ETO15496.1 hypothetical protein RFI_21867 [Reticulomyxa filosa]